MVKDLLALILEKGLLGFIFDIYNNTRCNYIPHLFEIKLLGIRWWQGNLPKPHSFERFHAQLKVSLLSPSTS
jgi:hypothetical protein